MTKSAFILFGSTGSLAKEKIIPSLYSLFKKANLKNTEIVLYGRQDFETSTLKQELTDKYPQDFTTSLNYIKGDLNDISNIVSYIQDKDIAKVFFYISLPPNLYPEVIDSISKVGKNIEKIIALEKPFGTSLKNAQELSFQLESVPNTKVYLVDHYLAKEPVINLTKIDINKIKNIKISILETVDVSQRGEFFDNLGMIKDVGQNHMLNLLSKLTGSLKNVYYKRGSLEIGQYSGYTNTKGVKEKSKTETYFKAKFGIKETNINIEFEAGKALKDNAVYLQIECVDGTKQTIYIKPPEKPITKEAHEYVIEDILSDTHKFAVSIDEALIAWSIIGEVLEDRENTKLKIY